MGAWESLNFRTHNTWGDLIGPKSARLRLNFTDCGYRQRQIRARPRLSDQGPESDFSAKYSKPIRGRVSVVGLFPGVATLRMTIVFGQCLLSWSEGPLYPQKRTFRGPRWTSGFDPQRKFWVIEGAWVRTAIKIGNPHPIQERGVRSDRNYFILF